MTDRHSGELVVRGVGAPTEASLAPLNVDVMLGTTAPIWTESFRTCRSDLRF
jgi:hypothetical protein